jgi:hypothetical protein
MTSSLLDPKMPRLPDVIVSLDSGKANQRVNHPRLLITTSMF